MAFGGGIRPLPKQSSREGMGGGNTLACLSYCPLILLVASTIWTQLEDEKLERGQPLRSRSEVEKEESGSGQADREPGHVGLWALCLFFPMLPCQITLLLLETFQNNSFDLVTQGSSCSFSFFKVTLAISVWSVKGWIHLYNLIILFSSLSHGF